MTTENETTEEKPKKARRGAKAASVDAEKGAEWEAAAADAAEATVAARQDAMPPRRFESPLPCKLTDAELGERGQQLSAAMGRIEAIAAKRKIANDGFKAETEIEMVGVRALQKVIDNEEEDRNVEQCEHFDLRRQSAMVVRTDTGETVSERALRQSELQPELPMTNGENGHAQMSLGDVDPTDINDAAALLKDAEAGGATPSNVTLQNDPDGEDDDGEDDLDEDAGE